MVRARTLLIAAAAASALVAGCDDGDPAAADTGVGTLDTADDDATATATADATTGIDGADPDAETLGDIPEETDVGPAYDELVFPPGFMWGTAIAGFQVDMGCPTLDPLLCNDEASDWFAYTTDPATVDSPATHMSGEDVRVVGPGFWELYPDDIARASDELGNNALRVSIEWSRIFPTSTEGVTGYADLLAIADADAIATYHAQFQAMREKGLEPVVTLNHYTLPRWIHDPVACHVDFATCALRGWVDKDKTVAEIAKYAGFCAEEFGAEVDVWATLNEPLQNLLFGYVFPNPERTHPPAVNELGAARIVLDALIEGHARMYDAVKAADTIDADGDGDASFIGVVYPLAPMTPANPNRTLDQEAAANLDYLWNRAFLLATAKGVYDANLDRTPTFRDDLAGRMDWVGVNYYFGFTLAGTSTSLLPEFSPLVTVDILSLANFGENRPEALPELLGWIETELDLPVIISENGDPVEGGADGDASDFLVRNLWGIRTAMDQGVDVRGYFYWSLTDNFEWNHGMAMDFGLYAIDPTDPSKARTLRQTGTTYAEITATNTVSAARVEAAFAAD